MGYDIAVFEGEPPRSHTDALSAFERASELLESDHPLPPTTRITGFVEALVSRWPGASDDEFKVSPWKAWPLQADAVPELTSRGFWERLRRR